MVTKSVPAKFCDMEGCDNPAVYICASCGKDLCSSGHTHKYGDGGHLEHAIKIDVTAWPYGGRERIILCPKCYTELLPVSLYSIVNTHGNQIDQK